MKGCLEPVKKKVRRKPLTELYVKGSFTEDREEWQNELQRHCEEVHTDQEETREVQEHRIESFKKKVTSNLHSTAVRQKSQLTWCCRPGPI